MPFITSIPELDTDELITILEEFGADYAQVSGENVQANKCPFHGNDSATLGISVNHPYPVNCFNPACSARSPDIVSLIARFIGGDEVAAVGWLYQKFPNLQRVKSTGSSLFNLEDDEIEEVELIPIPPTSMFAYDMAAKNDEGYRAADHYNEWTKEDCDFLEIGYDRINRRLIFPVHNHKKELVGLIGRNMMPNIKNRWFNYDKETFKLAFALLGDHLEIDRTQPIVVCEGASDYFQFLLLDVPNPRSIMGSKFSEWQVAKLASYGQEVIIVFDKDKAGCHSSESMATKLRERGCKCRQLKTPKGVDDPRQLDEETIVLFMDSINGRSLFDLDNN